MSELGTQLACTTCGSLNSFTARFCNSCGKEVGRRQVQAEQPAFVDTTAAEQRKVCPGCHKANDATAGFCYACGVMLGAAASAPAHGEPAGFWIRALALCIDIGLMFALEVLVEGRLGLNGELPDNPTHEQVVSALPGFALGLFLEAVYSTIMVGQWGGTIGKLLLGLRVIRNSDGQRPTFGISFTRYFAQMVSLLPLGLGFLWVMLSPTRRGWHDYMCDTRVVRARAQ